MGELSPAPATTPRKERPRVAQTAMPAAERAPAREIPKARAAAAAQTVAREIPKARAAAAAQTVAREIPKARAAAAEPAIEASGFLQVGVRPYATVAVDGEVVGPTPLRRMTLSAGVHTVELTHPDYRPFKRKVTIRSGETTKLVVDLILDGISK
jgi:hypothetical protein